MRIMLDMDGVLADFVGRASKVFGFNPKEVNTYDLPKCLGLKPQDFWKKIDETEDFWESIEPYPWAKALVRKCYAYTDEVGILTSPSLNPKSTVGKVEWVRKHFPKLLSNLVIVINKIIVWSPNMILIDDNEFTIRRWRGLNGKCILFPQPWNKLSCIDNRLEYVANELSKMFRLNYP